MGRGGARGDFTDEIFDGKFVTVQTRGDIMYNCESLCGVEGELPPRRGRVDSFNPCVGIYVAVSCLVGVGVGVICTSLDFFQTRDEYAAGVSS